MRCKNCGSENEEKLYICQNCGSPLYDENEPVNEGETAMDEIGATKVVPVVTPEQTSAPAPQRDPNEKDEAEKKKQQTTIIIVVLVVVLAIVIGVIAGVLISKKNTNNTTTTAVATSQTTTETTTKKETTTQATTTTTTTTQPTTKETTVKTYEVKIRCSTGGSVSGSGNYEENSECIAVATTDPGFEFKCWTIDGEQVSSKQSYTFKVKANTNLKAEFVETQAND